MKTMLIIALIAIAIINLFSQQLFGRFKWYRHFACRIIHWHSYPHYDSVRKDSKDPLQFLTFAKCKWCGYEGQVDSQGNLF